MAITAITIENFKGIREPVRVELKPITLLFGPNSAGKSTIVQALHYAREIFERQNLNPDKTLLGGESVDLGGFESLVNQHDLSLPITLRFDLDLANEDLPRYLTGYDDVGFWDWQETEYYNIPTKVYTAWVEVTVRWSGIADKPVLTSYQVGINGEKLATIEATEDGKQINLTKLFNFNPVFLDKMTTKEAIKTFGEMLKIETGDDDNGEKTENDDDGSNSLTDEVAFQIMNLYNCAGGVPGWTKNIALRGQVSAMPTWGRPIAFDREMWRDDGVYYDEEGALIEALSALITGPGELVKEGLARMCYVGPLREVPKRGHRPASSPEESRWANGLAAYDALFSSQPAFIDKVNEWLTQEERLDSGYSVEVKRYRELENDHPLMLAMLQDRVLDEDMDFRDQLLALPVMRRLLIRDEARDIELAPQDIGVGISQVLPVVVAALHQKTGIVAIEQPELHIHPAFQVALGDLFIEQIRERPDLTFILETHSEHLMLRFLRRIRETGESEAPDGRTLTPAELSVYFIEQGENGIVCTSIRVDEEGDFIDRWPKGFFAERAEELF